MYYQISSIRRGWQCRGTERQSWSKPVVNHGGKATRLRVSLFRARQNLRSALPAAGGCCKTSPTPPRDSRQWLEPGVTRGGAGTLPLPTPRGCSRNLQALSVGAARAASEEEEHQCPQRAPCETPQHPAPVHTHARAPSLLPLPQRAQEPRPQTSHPCCGWPRGCHSTSLSRWRRAALPGCLAGGPGDELVHPQPELQASVQASLAKSLSPPETLLL